MALAASCAHPGGMNFTDLPGLRRRSRTSTAEGASTPVAPRAQRVRSSRRTDLRLWLGLALVVASMFVGAHLMSQDAPTVTVWQASRDLSAGTEPAHLQPVTVALGSVSADYLPVEERPVGELRFPIAQGELIPRSALAQPSDEPTRIVTVGVDPLHAPIDLAAGDRVDVWSTPSDGPIAGAMTGPTSGSASGSVMGDPGGPNLVLEGALVEAVSADSFGSQLAVVVRVAPEDVATLVQASRAGVIDLVSVPALSQVSSGAGFVS